MTVPVTAIVTACQRVEQTLNTLRVLSACEPAPDEIVVHVDGNQTETLEALQARFPDVHYLCSRENLGPGGGRNKMIAAATHELVASFDDDSYPIANDFFARVQDVAARFPASAVFGGSVFHQGEDILEAGLEALRVADFVGCGCVYRRSVFLPTGGYVPLSSAYGMEEVDLALRLHAVGWHILQISSLRVFHDTDLRRHADAEVTAASIANIFLLTFLRYPVAFWLVGCAQAARRIAWLLTHGRQSGVITGILRTPGYLYRYRCYRTPLSLSAVSTFLWLRRHPVLCLWPQRSELKGAVSPTFFKALFMEATLSAIVTAHRRIDQTLATLRMLASCTPPPDEILVHVDDGHEECAAVIAKTFPRVKVLLSNANLGPGGGRNKLVKEAANDLVVSFDDDSYPMDLDYFARIRSMFAAFPEASIVTGRVFHQGEVVCEAEREGVWAADFCGGACAYRRSHFMDMEGYVPLPVAYGMEEVDLALRLHAMGRRIIRSSWLRVFHNTDLVRHARPEVTAGSITNIALLTFLRYPVILWPAGLFQLARRVLWLMTHGRCRGILAGLCRVPACLWKNRAYRATLSVRSVAAYLRLRRNPLTVPWPVTLS